jgi:uncharacterized protein (DUF2345 family)
MVSDPAQIAHTTKQHVQTESDRKLRITSRADLSSV